MRHDEVPMKRGAAVSRTESSFQKIKALALSLTDYYSRFPILLARLARLDAAALRDLLLGSCRLTAARARPNARARRRGSG